MNPKCPFCDRPLTRISDNAAYESFGCEGETCKRRAVWLYRAKEQPPKQPGLTPISHIRAPKP